MFGTLCDFNFNDKKMAAKVVIMILEKQKYQIQFLDSNSDFDTKTRISVKSSFQFFQFFLIGFLRNLHTFFYKNNNRKV